MPERDYIRDGAEIYRRSFAMIRARGRPLALRARGGAARRAHHPCLRHGRDRARRRHGAGPRRRRAGGAAGGRADPVRFEDGRERRHPRPAACRQRGRLHARRPARRRRSPATSATRARRRRWSCGGERLGGAVVAIGNAPTALFRLMDMIDAGAPRPAAIIGIPVGFVGAAESKEELAAWGTRALARRARPQGRQRHGGGGAQRAGVRGRSDERRRAASTASASGRAIPS